MRTLSVLVWLCLVGCDDASIIIDDTDGAKDDTGDTDTGSVVSGAIQVSPPSIDLGVVFVGATRSEALEVTNVGDGEVEVTLSVVGGWATAYTLDAYTSAPAPGTTATHRLGFTPTTWGDHSVSVMVDDAISGGHVEVAVLARVQIDADGDGYGDVETGGDDCDDTEATVNPGATETWYDGVDADCAGDDDYDQDADGHQAAEYGGDDCNDTDVTVHPDAVDTWYDGVDSDCAGNDDYDQDADGHRSVDHGGDDCNDTDATVHPGATETWYDGVDSDCAGDSDYDQDADGVDYPTDCNDTDPSTTGPTTETLNGNDDDCDGLVDDVAVGDVASGVLYGTTASMALGDHGLISMGGDVTGDGDPDLIVGAPVSTTGYLWVVDGAAAAAAAGVVSNYDTAAFTGQYSSGYYYMVGWVNGPMGDVDGDGTEDLLMGGNLNGYGYYARSYLFYGGSSLTGNIAASDYDVRFSSDSEYNSDGPRMAASGDMDGDGQADIAIGAYYDSAGGWGGSDYCGSVSVFDGDGLSDDTLELDEGEDKIYGVDDYDYLGYSLVMGDVTGDGYDDVVASAYGNDDAASNAGAVYVLPGNSSLEWDTYADDAAEIEIRGDAANAYLGGDTLAHPGDIDGSGQLDLGLTSEAAGEVWLFRNPGAGVMDVGDADHTFTGTAGDAGAMLGIDSDLDGDGADDIVIGVDSDDTAGTDQGLVHVLSWSSSWGASLTSADARATLDGGEAGGLVGSGGAGGADLDGDGREDVAVGERASDGGGVDAGAVWVIPGW